MESSSLQAQKNDFPLVFTAKGVQSATDLCAWVNEQKGDLLKSLQTSGAALLRGADVKDALDFASVVESFGLKNYPYVGGAAVRRNIVKDIVFTGRSFSLSALIKT